MKRLFLLLLCLIPLSCKHNPTNSQTKNISSTGEPTAVDIALAEVMAGTPGDGDKFWEKVNVALSAGKSAEANAYVLYFARHPDAWTPAMIEACRKYAASSSTLDFTCEHITVLKSRPNQLPEKTSQTIKSMISLAQALSPESFLEVNTLTLFNSFQNLSKEMDPVLRLIGAGALLRNVVRAGKGAFGDDVLDVADKLINDGLKSADAVRAFFTPNVVESLRSSGFLNSNERGLQALDFLLSSSEQQKLMGMLNLDTNGTQLVIKVATEVWNTSLNLPDVDFLALYIAAKFSPLASSTTVKLADTRFDSDSLRTMRGVEQSVRAFSEKFHKDVAKAWGCDDSPYKRCPILQRFYSVAGLPLYWMLGGEAAKSGSLGAACDVVDAQGQSPDRQTCWVYQFIAFFQDESMTAAVYKDGEYTLNMLARTMAPSPITSYKDFKDEIFMNKGSSQSARRTAVMNYLCNEYSFLSGGAGWSSDEGVPDFIVRPFANFSRVMFASIAGNAASPELKAEFSDRHRVAPGQRAYCFEDMFLTRVDEPVRNYMVDYIYNEKHFQKVGP